MSGQAVFLQHTIGQQLADFHDENKTASFTREMQRNGSSM
jgi:hypothetical protein